MHLKTPYPEYVMKAIVLAAGYGTRLRPLSNKVPKPLVPVMGRPLIRHILHKLKTSGITDVGINTHYQAAMIRSCVSETISDVPVYYSHEPRILGAGGGIGGFRPWLEGTDYFILHNGDILSDIRLEPLIALCRSAGPLGVLVLHDHPQYNNVSINKNRHIVDLRGALQPENTAATLAYAGIACLSTDLLADIPSGPADLIPVLLNAISRTPGSLIAHIPDNPAWSDIGSVADYHRAHEEILVRKQPLIDSRLIPAGQQFFGPRCTFADDVRLEGFIAAGSGCVFGNGSYLRNTIIWDNASVPEQTCIKNAVIGKGWITHV
jgi:mannose-1-phosphate guanylyltransferase